MTIVAGIDFGTASVRVTIVEAGQGRIGSGVSGYPTRTDPADPHLATQRFSDHLDALERAVATAVGDAGCHGHDIAALAVATTGSTVCFVDRQMRPIDDCSLWCDHRAVKEAAEITAIAHERAVPAIAWCGGSYSPEWGFAKLLHWLRRTPERRADLTTAIEHCDLIVATLCGIDDTAAVSRSVCAMGHKWMWNAGLGGLPDEEFLVAVDPLLAGMRARLDGQYGTSDQQAGTLCRIWADRLGLRAGIPIPIGALDAHWDAIGAGCRPGDVVNVIGTSSCIMALAPRPARPIVGVPGVVDGSIDPRFAGIEAGIAAVGALFDAIARRAGTPIGALMAACADHRVGASGLVRLPWDNGDRSILAESTLRGITLGWRLDHSAADELFAAIEGTACQTRIIIEYLAAHDVPVSRVINSGGLARQSPVLNQVYADILARPVLVPEGDTTGLGAASFALGIIGNPDGVGEIRYRTYLPMPDSNADADAAYRTFRHHYFGLRTFGNLGAAA